MPALFGSERNFTLLLELHRGESPYVSGRKNDLLEKPGIITRAVLNGRHVWAIDDRHPLTTPIREFLTTCEPGSTREGLIPIRPFTAREHGTLGHYDIDFRILNALAHSPNPINIALLKRVLRAEYRSSIPPAIRRLESEGMLVIDNDTLALSLDVPRAYRELIQVAAAHRAKSDPTFLPPDFAIVDRPAAYVTAPDGAPRLFGTDVRLRNLMALAVHGPLWHREIRQIVGMTHQRPESYNDAPFGRGDLVRVWEVSQERALTLDEAHPLSPPLRLLLVALSKIYPLKPIAFEKQRPPLPEESHEWDGDRLSLFGSPIPTLVLLSLADRHWTFESHICAVAADYYRENVKKAIHRLEDEGVLAGSRPRGPGFGPRLLRLAEDCPARKELEALIDVAAIAWPDLGARIRTAFNGMPNKTKIYFRNREIF